MRLHDTSFLHRALRRPCLGAMWFTCCSFCVYTEDHLVFESSQTMTDIPYGDCFTVDLRWDVKRDHTAPPDRPQVGRACAVRRAALGRASPRLEPHNTPALRLQAMLLTALMYGTSLCRCRRSCSTCTCACHSQAAACSRG